MDDAKYSAENKTTVRRYFFLSEHVQISYFCAIEEFILSTPRYISIQIFAANNTLY